MKNHQGAKMEKPRISPDGESLWQPNGARQRYARRLTEEVDLYRLFAVAAQVFRHRKVERGEIGPNDGISPSKEEVLDVIARSDFRQLRLLRKMALSLIVTEEPLH